VNVLFFYDGSKKIAVGYKKDDEGRVAMINGKTPKLMKNLWLSGQLNIFKNSFHFFPYDYTS